MKLNTKDIVLVELDKADFLISEAQEALRQPTAETSALVAAVAQLADAMALISATVRARAGRLNEQIDSTQPR